MSENMTPELTLTPDAAAAAPAAPVLTLDPVADTKDAAAAQAAADAAAQAQRDANAVKLDESMLTEEERKMVADFAELCPTATTVYSPAGSVRAICPKFSSAEYCVRTLSKYLLPSSLNSMTLSFVK